MGALPFQTGTWVWCMIDQRPVDFNVGIPQTGFRQELCLLCGQESWRKICPADTNGSLCCMVPTNWRKTEESVSQ